MLGIKIKADYIPCINYNISIFAVPRNGSWPHIDWYINDDMALLGVAERTLKMNILNYACTKCTKQNSVIYTEFIQGNSFLFLQNSLQRYNTV